MPTTAILAAFSTALALSGLLAACDALPTGPSPAATGIPGQASTGGPDVARIEIVGPPALAPGETAQFNLIAHLTDGSRRDVTNDARWSAADWPPGSVLSIAGPGLATGRERGDAWLRAVFSAGTVLSNAKDVIVVPAGTYRLNGVVSEAGVQTRPVSDALVEVTTGAGAGLFTSTRGDGSYRLYGVSGESNIRVTKDGYQPQTQTVIVTDHQTLDITLP